MNQYFPNDPWWLENQVWIKDPFKVQDKGGRETQEGGDMGRNIYIYTHICIADSLCYKAEANTPL